MLDQTQRRVALVDCIVDGYCHKFVSVLSWIVYERLKINNKKKREREEKWNERLRGVRISEPIIKKLWRNYEEIMKKKV